MPYPDASFDLVVSLCGAMFAPRPARLAAELVRVCRPSGHIAMKSSPCAYDMDGGIVLQPTDQELPPGIIQFLYILTLGMLYSRNWESEVFTLILIYLRSESEFLPFGIERTLRKTYEIKSLSIETRS